MCNYMLITIFHELNSVKDDNWCISSTIFSKLYILKKLCLELIGINVVLDYNTVFFPRQNRY